MTLKIAAALALLSSGAQAFQAGVQRQSATQQRLRTASHGQTWSAPTSSAETAQGSFGPFAKVAAAAGIVACAAARTAGQRRRNAAAKAMVMPVTTSSDRSCLAGGMQVAERDSSAVTAHAIRPVKSGNWVKRGPYAKYRRQDMWLKYAKSFKGRASNVHSIAKRAVIRALKQKYKSRRLFKRERRTLWIMRVNANCKLHGVNYSQFIQKLKVANVNINRKIMSQLAVYDRPVFTNLMNVAMPDWQERLDKKTAKPKEWTTEEIDDVTIPYLEYTVPELYTDDTIRFNRKVQDWGVEYTVDMGDPEMWREVLPKMPELANFNLPDHWTGNANAEYEALPLELLKINPERESEDHKKFMRKVAEAQADDEARIERGEKAWPKKEGVSREDWFKEDPQSWF